MKEPLWTPSEERIQGANITSFMSQVNQRYDLDLDHYHQLYRWSIDAPRDFWAAVWDFAGIRAAEDYDQVVDDLDRFPGAKWFPGARLNFAHNLLRYRDDRLAFIFKGEDQVSRTMTYGELYAEVAEVAQGLREQGVGPGDRVVGYLPNLIETAVAMLAATSLGATWASCATDIGPRVALDRLGQVDPVVMFTADGYFYKGREHHTLENAAEVARGMSSLKKVIVVPYLAPSPVLEGIPGAVHYPDFKGDAGGGEINFVHLPADHPLYIMFSSGTTGKPKCMVQGVGGVLVNHLKELLLHTDLKRQDRITYITTPSWMMWNWLISSLAVGATVLLYDGNPLYPHAGRMWQLIEQEELTIFGTSATYLNTLRREGMKPGGDYDLSSLKEISQTGSPLSPSGFRFVYREIKEDLHLNSISGGTDINGCFAAGDPTRPVYAGELQGPALGMKVRAYDDKGRPVQDQKGELVCEMPAPSMPLYFWEDAEDQKYRQTYFDHYPGRQVWRHGDFVVHHSDTGGFTFYGRSDTVLKPAGVRIGTAEIYHIVESLEEVEDSLAVGQRRKDGERVLLFVKPAEGETLAEDLKEKIRDRLFNQASPRHVPAVIMAVPDIPYTFSGKKVETAVDALVNGRPVPNRGALTNPASLDYFETLLPQLEGPT